MPPDLPIWLTLLLAGGVAILLGLVLLRASGARMGMARRLGGAREWKVGDLAQADPPPARPVRVVGRIRCPDPLVLPSGERLVAYHRDIEVQTDDGGWRAIERMRETRSFELWDHAGSLVLDPAEAAEPLVAIPYVWQGRVDELEEVHRSAAERVAGGGGRAAARATTRTIPVVERLLVLARVVQAEDRVRLMAPPGGYIISTLPLDAAMRLLAGNRRRRMAVGLGLAAAGGVTLVAGGLATLLTVIG